MPGRKSRSRVKSRGGENIEGLKSVYCKLNKANDTMKYAPDIVDFLKYDGIVERLS